jgi:hypothetical protein
MAVLTINEILYEFSKELGFEALNSKKKSNPKRIFDNEVNLDKKWADLFESSTSILEVVTELFFSKKIELSEDFNLFSIVHRFQELSPSIEFAFKFKQDIFNKIISHNSIKEEIFYQLFKYAFIPLFVNIHKKDDLEHIKKLFPNKETILNRFKDLIEDSDFQLFLDKQQDNFLVKIVGELDKNDHFKRKTHERITENNEIPITLNFMMDHFHTTPTIIRFFLYAKTLNFMFKVFGKNKSCELISFMENLIDNPEENKKYLDLNTSFIVESINKNLSENKSDKLETLLKEIQDLEKKDNPKQLKIKYEEIINFGQKEEMIGKYLDEFQTKYRDLSKIENFSSAIEKETKKRIEELNTIKNTIKELINNKNISISAIEKDITEKFVRGEDFTIKDIEILIKDLTEILTPIGKEIESYLQNLIDDISMFYDKNNLQGNLKKFVKFSNPQTQPQDMKKSFLKP